jgi:ATP adenylyltransferase
MEFVAGTRKTSCFLCDKAAESADAANHIVARGRWTFLLLNTFPYNSGHLLVAPYRHVPDLADLTLDERGELLDLVVKAQSVMQELMRPDGFNFGFNLGAAAGAGVPGHLHGHLVPRWIGDTNFMPVLGDTRVVPQALDDTARLLRKAWKDHCG